MHWLSVQKMGFLVVLSVLGLVCGMGAALFPPVLAQVSSRREPIVPALGGATVSVPVAPLVLAQDTFQRPDQPLWGRASDGHAWTEDANTRQNFSIVGATGRIANGQGTFNALLGPVSTDVEVQMTGSVNRFPPNGSVNLGAVVRWTSDTTWYKALIDGTHLTILKRVRGTTTTLISVPFPAQAGVVYALRFRAVGSLLFANAWRWDTAEPAQWIATASDATLPTGQTGIRVLLLTGSVATITSFLATHMS